VSSLISLRYLFVFFLSSFSCFCAVLSCLSIFSWISLFLHVLSNLLNLSYHHSFEFSD
jgi:hypothetical protein